MRVGDERLQRVGADRQPHAGPVGDGGDVAADGGDHRAGTDVALRGLHAGDAVAVLSSPVTGVCWKTCTPGAQRTLRVRPHHAIVTSGRALVVVAGAVDRVAPAAGQVDLRAQALDLVRDGCSRSWRPSPGSSARASARCVPCSTEWASQIWPFWLCMIQQPVSVLELLVHLQAVLVERHALGDAVVAADDRGVPAGVARADVVGSPARTRW